VEEYTNLETVLRHRKAQQEETESVEVGGEEEAKFGVTVVEETPTLVHNLFVGLAVGMLERERPKTK